MADVKYAEPRPIASPLYLRDEELKQGVDLALPCVFRPVRARREPACARRDWAAPITARCISLPAIRGFRSRHCWRILKITKQSLNRVLNDLLSERLRRTAAGAATIAACASLRLTAKGAALEAAPLGSPTPAAGARLSRSRARRGAGLPPRAGGARRSGAQAARSQAMSSRRRQSAPPRRRRRRAPARAPAAISERQRFSRQRRRRRGRGAHPDEKHGVRSSDPRRDDAGRIRPRSDAGRARAIRRCRS